MSTDRSERAVAIVGLGAILPDAPNAPAFRDNVWKKRYSIIEVPPERWNVDDYYDPDPAAPDKTYSKIGSWVRGFEFDWKRCKIPPKVGGSDGRGTAVGGDDRRRGPGRLRLARAAPRHRAHRGHPRQRHGRGAPLPHHAAHPVPRVRRAG